MAIARFEPSNLVDIGVGKDNVNDFAVKYNNEIAQIYSILNNANLRKANFLSAGDYWTTISSGFRMTIPHNGNFVFGVYKMTGANGAEYKQVFPTIVRNNDNVLIDTTEKFDGFLLYAVLNGNQGLGQNLPEDFIDQLETAEENAERAETALASVTTLKSDVETLKTSIEATAARVESMDAASLRTDMNALTTSLSGKLSLTGGTVTGDISANSNTISAAYLKGKLITENDNDRFLRVRWDGSRFVADIVNRAYNNALGLKVNNAAYADSAGSAGSASSATSAGSATSATYASYDNGGASFRGSYGSSLGLRQTGSDRDGYDYYMRLISPSGAVISEVRYDYYSGSCGN